MKRRSSGAGCLFAFLCLLTLTPVGCLVVVMSSLRRSEPVSPAEPPRDLLAEQADEKFRKLIESSRPERAIERVKQRRPQIERGPWGISEKVDREFLERMEEEARKTNSWIYLPAKRKVYLPQDIAIGKAFGREVEEAARTVRILIAPPPIGVKGDFDSLATGVLEQEALTDKAWRKLLEDLEKEAMRQNAWIYVPATREVYRPPEKAQMLPWISKATRLDADAALPANPR